MEYRPFGQTGLEVSAIGFGCWEVGGGYGAVEEADFARAVGRALDLGINCFDTAEGYGHGVSERALGKALGTRRDDAIIVTKFGMNYKDMPNLRDSSADARESLDRQEPRGARHRPCRRLPRPLPRPAHTLRGDDERARGRRPGGQGPLRGSLQLQARRDPSVQEDAAHRRRAVRLEHVRPSHAARDPPVLRRARHRLHGVRIACLRSAHGHLHREHGLRQPGLALPPGEDGVAAGSSTRSSARRRSRTTCGQ